MDQSETSQINYTSPSGEDSLHPLPPEFMVVSSTSWILIVTSAIVFVLGSIGNVYAVVCLRRFLRYTYSSMHHFLLHMCCTELLVISFTIPLDIIWRLSIGWYAGNLTCKFANFARCLIYILNSLVLVFMCIDCFINIFFGNLSKQRTVRRVRVMIAVSWVIALISAIPKFFLSYVATLPSYDAFRQCLLERAHAFFSVYPLVESYFAPLIVVLLTYTPVFFRICKKFEKLATNPGHAVPARPGDSIDKTQVEGVKITFAFSLVVILCYTPQISLIVWQYLCPNFRPSGDWLVYLIESSKSVFIPAAYFIFRSRDSSGFRGRNQMEFT